MIASLPRWSGPTAIPPNMRIFTQIRVASRFTTSKNAAMRLNGMTSSGQSSRGIAMGLFVAAFVVAMAVPASVSAGVVTYSYDNAGRLTAVGYGPGSSLSYTYDAMGNMTARTAVSRPYNASVSINAGAETTSSVNVVLSLAASGATTVKVSEFNDSTLAETRPLADTASFTLSSSSGIKTVYVFYLNAGGGCTTVSDTISLVNVLTSVRSFQAAADSANRISLSWQVPLSDQAAFYEIWCDSGSGTASDSSLRVVLPRAILSWQDSLPAVGRSYTYWIATKDTPGTRQAQPWPSAAATVTSGGASGSARAAVTFPLAGWRISGNMVFVRADTTSGTAAGVLFQYRRSTDTQWTAIAPPATSSSLNPDSVAPYFVHWDVSSLSGTVELRARATDHLGVNDSAPPSISVTVDTTTPDVLERLVSGEQEKTQRVTRGETAQVEAGETGVTRLVIPPLAFSGNTAVKVSNLGFSTWIGLSDTVSYETPVALRGLTIDNGDAAFGDTVYVQYDYLDSDGNGVIDGTRIRAHLARLYYFNTATSRFDSMPTTVDTALRRITGQTRHFSTFAFTRPVLVGDLGVSASDTVPDGRVDANDLLIIRNSFGSRAGQGGYVGAADLSGAGPSSGVIDFEDMAVFGRHYGSAQ